MAENEETVEVVGDITDENDYPDVRGAVDAVMTQLYGAEGSDTAYSRGPMEDELAKQVVFYLSRQTPAVRASLYSTYAMMALTDPDSLTDVEIMVYVMGAQDGAARDALQRGEVQPMVEGGPEDLDNNGIVDMDWYNDNVPGGAGYRNENVQKFYMELFGAKAGPIKSISESTLISTGEPGTFYVLPSTDEMGEAVSSGWNMETYDPNKQKEYLSGHDELGSQLYTALDVITTLAAVAYGGAGLIKGGKAAYGAVKSAGGVSKALSEVKYLGRGIQAASTGKAAIKAAAPPEWLQMSQYVSARVGQPIQSVITNAASSENTALRLTGRAASAMTRSRARIGMTVAASSVFGGYAVRKAISSLDPEGYASGQDQIEAEREERDRQLGVTARWNSEESVLKRETQRREEARETYGGAGPEVTK